MDSFRTLYAVRRSPAIRLLRRNKKNCPSSTTGTPNHKRPRRLEVQQKLPVDRSRSRESATYFLFAANFAPQTAAMASLVGRDPSTEELYTILNGLPAVKAEFNNVMIRLKRRYVRFDAGAVVGC